MEMPVKKKHIIDDFHKKSFLNGHGSSSENSDTSSKKFESILSKKLCIITWNIYNCPPEHMGIVLNMVSDHDIVFLQEVSEGMNEALENKFPGNILYCSVKKLAVIYKNTVNIEVNTEGNQDIFSFGTSRSESYIVKINFDEEIKTNEEYVEFPDEAYEDYEFLVCNVHLNARENSREDHKGLLSGIEYCEDYALIVGDFNEAGVAEEIEESTDMLSELTIGVLPFLANKGNFRILNHKSTKIFVQQHKPIDNFMISKKLSESSSTPLLFEASEIEVLKQEMETLISDHNPVSVTLIISLNIEKEESIY